MKSETLENMIERLITFCLDHYWIKRLWSFLPSRCVFSKVPGEECENRYLRWTENLVAISSEPIEYIWVCKDCLHRMRQISFAAGHTVEHLPNGWVSYTPTSQEE